MIIVTRVSGFLTRRMDLDLSTTSTKVSFMKVFGKMTSLNADKWLTMAEMSQQTQRNILSAKLN